VNLLILEGDLPVLAELLFKEESLCPTSDR
jgi:hypothetical protein